VGTRRWRWETGSRKQRKFFEANKLQVRASPKLQQSRDEHILAKAEERVARKNLEFKEGNPCPTSLLSVNKDLALNCLQQIGLNLGESSLEKTIIFITCWILS
jgi:hypothetical protein